MARSGVQTPGSSAADTAQLTTQELLLGFTEISTWMLFLIGEGRLCLHGMHWSVLILHKLPVTEPNTMQVWGTVACQGSGSGCCECPYSWPLGRWAR